MNLSTYLKGIDHNFIEKGKKYAGKKLFSKIIPDKINIKYKKTEIKDGDLINQVTQGDWEVTDYYGFN